MLAISIVTLVFAITFKPVESCSQSWIFQRCSWCTKFPRTQNEVIAICNDFNNKCLASGAGTKTCDPVPKTTYGLPQLQTKQKFTDFTAVADKNPMTYWLGATLDSKRVWRWDDGTPVANDGYSKPFCFKVLNDKLDNTPSYIPVGSRLFYRAEDPNDPFMKMMMGPAYKPNNCIGIGVWHSTVLGVICEAKNDFGKYTTIGVPTFTTTAATTTTTANKCDAKKNLVPDTTGKCVCDTAQNYAPNTAGNCFPCNKNKNEIATVTGCVVKSG